MSEQRLPEGMAVKRVGEVVVVEFFRHRTHPYRPARPAARPARAPRIRGLAQGLRGLLCRALKRVEGAVCRELSFEEPVVDYSVVEDVILKTFGTGYQYHVFVSDVVYALPSVETIKRFLEVDDTDSLYYARHFADCDDFAFVLQGAQERYFWGVGYAFGILWYYTERFGHAVNFFIDRDRQLWIVEPQNDSILKWCSNQDYCGYAYVVIV
jgi:hypothetical protein